MSKNIYQVPRWVKQSVKNELYQYWKNEELLEGLKKDIIESSIKNDGQPRGNMTSNTTEQKAIKIISNRRIIETEKRINYIKEAVKKLNEEEKEVFEIIFREGYNQRLAETQKYISKHTYYNTIDKIVYFTALEFGYI